MNSKMKTMTVGFALAGVLISSIALAHTGATGVVKERMDGMVALRDGVRNVTPMMRGQTDYDADAIAAFAQILQEHSGEAMTELFPEGSGGGVSKAQDAVWSDWEEFEALAMRLELLGEALALASVNGLGSTEGGDASTTDMMGMGSTMTTDTEMGGMMGTAAPEVMDLDTLAALPVSDLFTQIGQSCSACHTKYRAEGN